MRGTRLHGLFILLPSFPPTPAAPVTHIASSCMRVRARKFICHHEGALCRGFTEVYVPVRIFPVPLWIMLHEGKTSRRMTLKRYKLLALDPTVDVYVLCCCTDRPFGVHRSM